MTDLIDTIKADISTVEQKFVLGAETVATEVYDILKVAVIFIGSSQAQVVLDLFNKVQTDVTAGKSLEEIETDLLQVASAEELVILKNAGSQLIQGLVAFIQAAKSV